MSKRIAVIGSGISGLVSAYLLSQLYEVTLFEANSSLGGHTATVDLEMDNMPYSIDTGFIVFNKKTYPNFCRLLEKLQIPIQPSEMSFSYRSDELALEYNGHNINTLFADRRNILRPSFYRMIKEILRFNKDAHYFLEKGEQTLTIGEFIKNKRYDALFLRAYLIPMIAAIWSTPPQQVLQVPAHFIFQFYANHGLLNLSQRPQWYVVSGGSKNYIPALIQPFSDRIRKAKRVRAVERSGQAVTLVTQDGRETFDAVVIATHSDQALSLLAKPTLAEKEILQAFCYSENEVILHTDESVLPKNKRARASWNYFDQGKEKVALTYYMNRLQGLQSHRHFCVSVNMTAQIAPETILRKFVYAHPNYQASTLEAQQKFSLINGKNNTYFCGAYWGYGFHEDGVTSALAACAALGVSL